MQTITVNGQPLTVKTIDIDELNKEADIRTTGPVNAFTFGERVTIETDTHTFKARLTNVHDYGNYGGNGGMVYTFRVAYLKAR